MNNLKERISAGDVTHGCWLNIGSSVTAEIIGSAGFDWVVIDMEHGIGTESDLLHQLQALGNGTTVPLVRVKSFDLPTVKQVLDCGANGIMFPQIQNADEANTAIANMQYPPNGNRGFAKMVRASRYGSNFQNYYEFTKDGLLGIVQIESKESLNHLDEIAALDGVDILFLGPADLSLSLGIFGQWEHPDFIHAVKSVGAAASNAGKAAGVLFFDMEQYDFYHQNGYRFIAFGSDMSFLNKTAGLAIQQLKDQEKQATLNYE